MIRGLIFDLDGTLYRASAVRRGMTLRLLLHVARAPGQGVRTLRFISAYRRAQEELRIRGGAIGLTDQLDLACRSKGTDPDWAAAVIARWMDESPLDLVRKHMRPGLVECLRSARARGIRIGLFSDYPPHAKLAAMGISDLFDVVRWAQEPEISAFKPDPRGLNLTLAALGVSAGDALYVGDRPDVDGEAARRAGMRAAIIGRRSQGDAAADGLFVETFSELTQHLS